MTTAQYNCSMSASVEWRELRRILGRHDLRRREYAASPWDGLLLGNGADVVLRVTPLFASPPCAQRWRLNKVVYVGARR